MNLKMLPISMLVDFCGTAKMVLQNMMFGLRIQVRSNFCKLDVLSMRHICIIRVMLNCVLAGGVLKIQINDGPMMDLIDQSNIDFKIKNAEKFTYVTTWFGVDVTFERRRPGKMMLIKTYVQPFWQARIQGKI